MKPWLDDLSEDWIPQAAASSTPPSHIDGSSASINQGPASHPKSRLPRMRHSSGSFSEIKIRPITLEKRPAQSSRAALAERSLSHNNISASESPDTSYLQKSRSVSRSFSGISGNSVIQYGTVEQRLARAATGKEGMTYNTPEWKKRLVKGEIGYGDQKDLFSPMGLENIFHQPPTKSSAASKPSQKKLQLLHRMESMPSSPPPWPSQEHQPISKRGNSRMPPPVSPLHNRRTVQTSRSQDQPQDFDAEPIQVSQNDEPSFNLQPKRDARDACRTASAQLEFENENFSPVILPGHNTFGLSNAASLNLNGSDNSKRLDNGNPTRVDGQSFAKTQDDSLPEGLPTGTPDNSNLLGAFVSVRRGGYSDDDSFKRRPLSPSPQKEPTLDEDQFPDNTGSYRNEIQIPPEASNSPSPSPITPRRQRRSANTSPERGKSKSPLKLFGTHDTFTSNRLQRRLSQLDHKSEKTSSNITRTHRTEISKVVNQQCLTSVEEEVRVEQTSNEIGKNDQSTMPRRDLSRVERFGQGQLDQYQFPEELSALSSGSSDLRDTPDESPSPDVAPPGSRKPLKFHVDTSPRLYTSSKVQRQGLTRFPTPLRKNRRLSQTVRSESAEEGAGDEPPTSREYSEGKRGPTSPFKDPTPKRRRTMYRGEEIEASEAELKPVQNVHGAMQSGISRKRKDARHGHSINIADPEILAQRHILRPRNPTPSQRRRDEIQAEIAEATEAFIHSSPKLTSIQEHLGSNLDPNAPIDKETATAVASEVAAFTLRRMNNRPNGSRAPSFTTKDFVNEATNIMEIIRTKCAAQLGFNAIQESDSEDLHQATSLTLSRPPSREGKVSAWREPNKVELSADVLSRLRRFQDKESDDFVASSVQSLRIGALNGQTSTEGDSFTVEQDDIRITDNQNRLDATSSNGHLSTKPAASQPQTNNTHSSSESSWGKTAVTNTSRRSEHVNTVAPEAVAHLIPDQVAGMTFNREQNAWVKQKSPSREHRVYRPTEDSSITNESEEDPLANIPDLTVDEIREIMAKEGPVSQTATANAQHLDEFQETEIDVRGRPVTRDGKTIPLADTSSAPSKFSNFKWSFPKTETRATSWSEQEAEMQKGQQQPRPATTYQTVGTNPGDIEHEIKIYEGRNTAARKMWNTRQRDFTISFSSPQPIRAHMSEKTDANDVAARQQTFSKQKAWHPMSGVKTLPSSLVPPIEEDGELSVLEELPKNYRMQLSMSLSAPVLGPGRQDALVPHPSSPQRGGDVTFMLSDLPDFTMNQIEESELPDRVVIKRDATGFSKAVEDRYAQGTAELVKALQDVEPDEPYWEDLLEVDIHDKGLSNLNRLDEFCFQLEGLDISNNDISQTKGIPSTIRRLRAQNNCFTGLTSWTYLMNLQYLDLSGNDVDSLEGLRQLFHLRTLKVNDNKVGSLKGVLRLDGLIELSARGNKIRSIDFHDANLKSLENLNLSGNGLSDVRNLHLLPKLQHLDLDDNHIGEFPAPSSAEARCATLKTLRLCRNRTTSLTVDAHCPNLEALYIDGNSLVDVSGLDRLKHLRTLSAREQILECDSDTCTAARNLTKNADIRNLCLSMIPTRTLDMSQHFLNLQRLELASLGLKSLPNDFGQLAANVRFLNLNFNSLGDLRPLLNIKRLNELLVAGNRLKRLRTNIAVLAKLTTLTKVDLRDNPLTLRFYAPAVENRMVSVNDMPYRGDDSDRFVLPAGSPEADAQHLARLDDETKLRRRVHEMMFASSCKNLRDLDGLSFSEERVGQRDEIWQRLLYLGIIKKTATSDGAMQGTSGLVGTEKS